MWQELSPGVLMTQVAAKQALDPLNLFNPAKVIGLSTRREPRDAQSRRSGMTSVTRRRVALAVATAALSGCGGSPEPAAAAAWQEPTRYTYELESSCGERALIGRFRITVEQGEVTAAEGLDESGRWFVENARSETAPTLGQLLDKVDRARQQGAAVAEVTTDPTDGRPTTINIDQEANAVDDESCFTIAGYTLE